MKRPSSAVPFSILFVAILLLTTSTIAQTSPAPDPPRPEYVDGEVIIKFSKTTGPSQASALAGEMNAAVKKELRFVGAQLWTLSGISVEDAVARYSGDPRVEYIEPNYMWYADGTFPDDPSFNQLWGMHNSGQTGGVPDVDIDAPEAWDISTGDSTVLVGVIDTGVDYNHEDLVANMWVNSGEIPGNGIDDDGNGYVDDVHGWDFANDDNDPMDGHGHGTHVSGTIGGMGNNGIGITGVCWNVRIVALKFLSDSGGGSSADAIGCLDYATMVGVRLTNNSWGGGPYSTALRDAIARADTAGILFIAAAGNDGTNNDTRPHYPSNYPLDNIISVANITSSDNLSSLSNWGLTSVDLGAPGSSILSSLPGNRYGTKSGTSMASPHVAGSAALIWSAAPGLSHDEVKETIMSSVDPTGALLGKTVAGGRLNAARALGMLDSIPPDPVADLAVLEMGSSAVTLAWTATGDDSSAGTAWQYDIRYSTSPIDAANFDSATPFAGVPAPLPAGSAETARLFGLDFNTSYYFAIKVIDENENVSPVSNTVGGTTLGIPALSYSPTEIVDTLLTGGRSEHVVTFRNPGAGVLDFNFENIRDVPTLGMHPYMFADPYMGSVAAGDSVRVIVTLDASWLPGGRHMAFALLKSNDPAWPVTTFTADMWVIDAPDIRLEPSSLAFGPQYKDVSVTDTVTVVNQGTAPLSVTSVTTNHSDYTVDALPFVLAAGESRALAVTFQPSSLGVIDAVLSVFSDDPDTPVATAPLYGQGMEPPEISLSPALIVSALRTGENAEQTLTISNSGGADLEWRITVIDSASAVVNNWTLTTPAPAASPDAFEKGHPPVPSAAEARMPITAELQDLTGVRIMWDLYRGVFDPGFWSTMVTDVTSRGATVTTNYQPITPEVLSPYDVVWINETSAWTPAEIAALQNWISMGGALLVESDESEVEYNAVLAGTGIAYSTGIASGGITTRIYPHAATTDINEIFLGNPLAHLSPLSTPAAALIDDWTGQTVGAVADFGGGRIAVFSDELFPDGNVGVADNQLFGNQLIDWLAKGVQWVKPLERSGTVPGYASYAVPIEFDATGLEGGTHEADLVVRSNDPFDPEAKAHAVLVVTPAPDIRVSATELYFGDVFVGGSRVDTLYVANDGVEDLAVTHIFFDDADYSAAPGSLTVAPGAVEPLPVVFSPTREGTIGAVVSIVSNDPDESVVEVALSGRAFLPPEAEISPATVLDNLITGAERAHEITLANNGVNDLEWSLEIDYTTPGGEWLRVTATSGTTAAGDTDVVGVTLDADRMPGGTYQANVTITTNDPAAPSVVIPVLIGVTDAPQIVVVPDTLDFGVVFTSVTSPGVFSIINSGTRALVVNEIRVASGTAFGMTPRSFSLAPGESQEVIVFFSPINEDPYLGTVEIVTNDPDEAWRYVRLFGEGLHPPEIALPSSLSEDLYTGELAVQQFDVGNTGRSPLEWRLEIRAPMTASVEYTMTPPDVERKASDGGDYAPAGLPRAAAETAVLRDLSGVRILYDRAHGQNDVNTIWSFIASDLAARGAEVTVNTEPVTADLLASVDVLWSTDMLGYFSNDELNNISAWVAGGGGLVLEGDNSGSVPAFNELLDRVGAGIRMTAAAGTPGSTALIHDHRTTYDIQSIYLTVNLAHISTVEYPAGRLIDDVAGVPNSAWSVVGAGRIVVMADEVFADGRAYMPNNRQFANQVFDWLVREVRWLALDVSAGITPPDGFQEVNASFDATGLAGGDYEAVIFATSNAPDALEMSIPVHMHVETAPDIVVDTAAMEFGTVYMGQSPSRALHVGNEGFVDLIVVPSTDDGDYSVAPDTMVVPPGAIDTMWVTFSPSSEDSIIAALTLSSNDPDEPAIVVQLSGEGLVPPVVSVAPDSLVQSLDWGGTARQQMFISNTGSNILAWRVDVLDADEVTFHEYTLAPPDLSGARQEEAEATASPRAAPPAAPLADTPFVAELEDLTGIRIMYDQAHGQRNNTAWSTMVFDLSTRGAFVFVNQISITQQLLSAVDVLWLTDMALPFQPAEKTAIVSWLRRGGSILFEGDDVATVAHYNDLLADAASGIVFTDEDGTSGNTTNIRMHETTRGINHIFLSENMAQLLPVTGYATVVVNDSDGSPNTAVDLVDVGRIFAAADELFENYRMSTSHNRLFGNQVFDWLAGAAKWMKVVPAAGTTDAGETDTLTVTFDGTRTVPGLHHGVLRTVSNDPVTPHADITALFDLAGAPVIAVSDTLLDFGVVYTNTPSALTLEVSNAGFEPLHVSGVFTDDPDFTADSTGFDLAPAGSRDIVVSLVAGAAGTYSGALSIVSDDPVRDTLVVALRGTAVDPPAIALSPESLSVFLTVGQAKTDTVVVYNTSPPGSGDLEFVAAVEPPNAAWLWVDSAVVVVAPGDSAHVAVIFDALQIFGGVYNAVVQLTTNVPGMAQAGVPVELTVEGVPALAVLDTLVEYGAAYVGYPVSRPVRIMNAGTDALVITAFEFDEPELSAQPDSFVVTPGETRQVNVTLLPSASGAYTATMTVTSNDPSHPGPHGRLTADVYPPPVASITPDSMHVALDFGDSAGYSVTLTNTGASDLFWSADIGDLSATGHPPADGSGIPGSVLFHGTHKWGGIDDWSAVIGDLEAMGAVVEQSTDAITSALLGGYDILWLGDRVDPMLVSEMQAVADWVMVGGTLLVEADNSVAITTYSTMLGRMSAGIFMSSSNPASGYTDRLFPHPATVGVTGLYAGTPQCRLALTGISGPLAESSDGKVIAAFSEPGDGRVLVCADQFFVNAFVDRDDNRLFATRVFAWLARVDWIALTPASGTVAPSESVSLVLSIDTRLIAPGRYDKAIRFASNDPAAPVITVPLTIVIEEVIIATVGLELEAGLNLRSWNVDTETDSTLWILAPTLFELRSARGFDGEGLLYDPALPPQFNTLVTMDHLHGYWIDVRNDVSMPVTGRRVSAGTPIPLRAGYNLISYLPQEADSVRHALASIIDKVQVVMGYDGGGLTWDPAVPPQVNSLQVLSPSFGYWVRLTEADTLVYPPDVLVPPAIAASPGRDAKQGGTAVENDDGDFRLSTRSREWIGVWGDAIDVGGEPIAAGTIVTALDPDGVVCGEFTVVRPGELGMMAVYRDDPATEADEGAVPGDPLTIVFSPTVDDAGDAGVGGEEVVFDGLTWTAHGDVVEFDEVVRISPTAVTTAPIRTELHQNYPNPFNPVTKITYDLRAPVQVELTVYSVRGERIRRLVGRAQGAGRYTVSWQGVNDAGQPVASGVYFYKLVAGDYVNTRKMILIK